MSTQNRTTTTASECLLMSELFILKLMLPLASLTQPVRVVSNASLSFVTSHCVLEVHWGRIVRAFMARLRITCASWSLFTYQSLPVGTNVLCTMLYILCTTMVVRHIVVRHTPSLSPSSVHCTV